MAIRRNRSLSSRKRRQSATQKRDFRIEPLEDRRLLAFAVGNLFGDNSDWVPPQGDSAPSAFGFPGVIPAGAVETDAGAFDVRTSQLSADGGNPLSSEQIQAALSLSIGRPDLAYNVDTLLGVPSFVMNRSGYLTKTSDGAAEEIAQNFLGDNAAFFGLTSTDTASLAVSSQHESNVSGVDHVYLQQTLNGLDVYNAVSNVSVDQSGRVLVVGNSFAPDVSGGLNRLTPAISAVNAIQAAAANLGVSLTAPLEVPASAAPANRALTYSDGGISRDPIPTKLMVLPMDRGASRLVWNLTVNMTDTPDWYNLNVDAETGDVLTRTNYTDYASYRVFPQPLESPIDGPGLPGSHTLVTDPFDPVASPFGWHDTNGATGAEFTITRGNNVWAFPDRDGNNASDGNEPNGGAALNFDFAFDPAASPQNNRDEAVVNLFYWNNIFHDVLVHTGFDEAAGNFQATNYSGNGLGGDAVDANAQDNADGGSANNANFATLPEGLSPRMQMFEFSLTNPRRDSDNSASIIVHEYGHGVSNRLVGGPNNVSALNGVQSGGMGEGWSDFYALALTAKPSQTGSTARVTGDYVLGAAGGIRRLPYSTDLSVNPLTYNDIDPAQIDVTFPPNPPADPRQAPADEVHNAGEVWASALWDMYWNLTNRDGFDPNLTTGSGGNNLAMKLVTEGMKFTPARPTMLEARDGIVAADVAMNGGANLREIWTAFARRGMGFSALDGGNDNSTAVTEAFDLPPNLPAPGGDPISGPSRVPRLLEVQTNDGQLLQPGDVLNTAPREFRLLFEGGSNLSEFTIADGVQLVGSGGDGDFTNGNEVIVTPGYVGLGDTANELVVRVAEPLVNDQYELTVIGSGLRPLTNIAGERFNDGVDETRSFELDLGAQVLSVVPQPITRDSSGDLVQNKREVVVYFNNDDLNPTDAENPVFYQLVQTNDTAAQNDDVILLPAAVTYDAAADTATLEFAADLPSGKFRLQVGVSEERDNRLSTAVRIGSIFSIAGTDFSTNASIGDDVGANDVDLYRFRLEAAATVNITATPAAALNTQLRLFSDVGVELNTSDNGAAPGAADTLASALLAAGTYYVGVSSSGNAAYNVLSGSGAAGGGTTGGYRLDIDSSLASSTSDDNSSFATATSLGNLGIGGQAVLGADLSPQTALVFPGLPGGNDEPGHRQIPVEDHGAGSGIGGGDNNVETLQFYFPVIYGNDPITGAPLTNAITANQKDRAREIFALYGEYLGVDIQETLSTGTAIITGDTRVVESTFPPDSIGGIAGSGKVVINGNIDFGDSPYGGNWFGVAFHEIGHSIGLGHSYDVPSIQGSGLPGEPVYPGDNDLIHAKRLHPLVGTDIDLYQFDVTEPGVFSAETIAERQASGDTGLDSALQLYREVTTPSGVVRELLAQNDDYFSSDPYLNIPLAPGRYYLGVSSTGNTNYDPTISDSGFGGTSQGAYDLNLNFTPSTRATLNDATGVALDGDADGTPGGVFNTWFQVGNTVFVDKANDTVAGPNGAGTQADPFDTVGAALAAASAGDIVRIVGNNLDRPYLVGENSGGLSLPDGKEFLVPAGITVMIDAGAVFKLQKANVDVGSNAPSIPRGNGALQVLGVPGNPVVFTSLHDDTIAGDSDGLSGLPASGDWGGLVFNNDSDYEDNGIFLNRVNNADIRYGGGKVFVNSVEDTFSPIHLATSRPTISYNTITNSANSAISADPNSFDDADGRIGPDVHGNRLFDNSINGLFVRVRVDANNTIDKLTVNGRFDDTDITHVLTENLVIAGTPGGSLEDAPSQFVARFDARLAIDPGVTVKLSGARIDVGFGAQLLAEGTPALPVVLTSLADDAYGFGNTFDTNGDGAVTAPAPADWSGLLFRQVATGSLDHALVAFGGGTSKLNGRVENFNAIEIQQADVRIANSTIENNASGQTNAARNGLRGNRATAIFVRGAQPILVNNIIRNNAGAAISINANAMQATRRPDYGRSTGAADPFQDFADNSGPLVRLNRLADNDLNGLEVRAERVVIDSIWDDTDIVHIVSGDISVSNLHTFGSLRLQSSRTGSLVVKLNGANAGFTATGAPGDIDDRIGGTVQIVGQAGHPVVLTSLSDDTAGAGFTPDGQAQIDTNGDGPSTGSAGNWRSIRFEKYANDANVAVVNEAEAASTDGIDINGAPIEAEFLGELAPNEKSGDDNRRLGFDVNGFISLNDASDVDVYSFTGIGGSNVWIDIDRTSAELDTVVELIDANGAVLAQSLDNDTFSGLATTLKAKSYLGGDFYTVNPHDAGFKVVLPGNQGVADTYFVRVRSQPKASEIGDISQGQTRGDYRLGIRLRQDERPSGSTVQLADIRFATNGIEVIGLPKHSPLLGESTETRATHDSFATAQPLGNLLSSDRNTISVGGSLANANQVDWYKFSVDYDLIESISGVNGGSKSFATVFDIDWADGLARPDTILSVFDAAGNLILVSHDSNVQDDRAGGGATPTTPIPPAGDLTDLSSGSLGPLDPYIGPVQLPAGSPAGGSNTYYLAISSNARIPTALNAQFVPGAAKPNVRLEPIDSINRVVEDHIGINGYSTGSKPSNKFAAVLPQKPTGGDAPAILPISRAAISLQKNVIPFTLADVRLFVSSGTKLFTVDPFNGSSSNTNVTVGTFPGISNGIQDIEIRSDGRIFGVESLSGVANTAGRLVEIDPGTADITPRGNDSIPNFDPATNPPDPNQVTTDTTFAHAFHRGVGAATYDQLYYSINDGTPNSRLYQANPANGSAAAVQNQPWGRVGGNITAGATAIGETQGMVFQVDTLYGVGSTGYIYTINTGNGAASILGQVPGGVSLTGIALGPQNVEDGRFANMLFVTGSNGRLYAFDPTDTTDGPTGSFVSIFGGAKSVNLGVSNPTGLAFSPLDFNLWHPTTKRGNDAGHGVTQAFDFSREDSSLFSAAVGSSAVGNPPVDRSVDVDERSGGASFYFGLENFTGNPGNGNYLPYDTPNTQLGILGQQEQQDLTSNPAIGGNFNLPGGAKGSLVTNEFSLADSVDDDLPTLYFTYFLDTLDTQEASTASNPAMLDSARVSISANGGPWSLLATNNSALSSPTTPAELGQFLSTSANAAGSGSTQTQVVQELFDTGNWRQARVDLRDYADQANLKLRFDFSTFGTSGEATPHPGDEFGNIINPEGGRDNNFEGFYVDDIVVGYAERGEIVTGDAGGNSLNTVTYNVPENPDLAAPEQSLTGAYQLEIRRGTEFIAGEGGAGNPVTAIASTTKVAQGLLRDTNNRFIRANSGLGDKNVPREQGHIQIEGNRISNVSQFGITVDAGAREAGNSLQFPGGVRNLPVLNTPRLAPGVTLKSNLITFVGQGGIFFSGDPNTGSTPLASVPFGRIVNNTIYGGNQATGSGILVSENAGPTILNNIVSNTATGISMTGSPQTVVISNLFKGNTTDGIVGTDAITLADTDPLFVDPVLENFYLANGSLAVDSSRNTLNERASLDAVKSIVGISSSTINAATRDAFGQLRVDDPNVDPLGQGANAFIDMGAVERADFNRPFAALVAPFDNDVEGLDSDPIRTVVQLQDGLITKFQLLFDDGPGIGLPFEGLGVDPATVSNRSIILNRDGKRLVDSVDYTFGYNATSRVIELTPLTGIWLPNSTYTIRLANREVTVATVPDGGKIQDGDSFTITDTAGSPVTFEFESGLSLQIPETLAIEVPLAGGSPGGIRDGDSFIFNFKRFEFDSNGQASSFFVIPFGDGANPSSRGEIADAIVVQLQASGVGVPRNLGDGVVHLGSQAGDFLSTSDAPTLIRRGIAGGVDDGQTFTITNGASLVDPVGTPEQIVTFEFENTDVAVPNGVAPGHVAISFSFADTADEIGIQTGQIVSTTAAVELPNALFVGVGRVHLGGRENTPTRDGHLIDSSLTTVSDFGDAGVLTSLRLNLPGGRDLFIPPAGGQLGGHNGGVSDGDTFTVDDGVTRTTFEFDHNGITNPNNTVIAFTPFFTQAQLAISVVVTLQNAPNLNLTPVNLGNGQIFIGGTPNHVLTVDSRTIKQPFKPGRLTDGETFILAEGATSLTFEFDSDGTVATGNTPINFSTVSTADQIVDEMVRVIGLSGLSVNPLKLGSDFLELGEAVGVQVDTSGASVFATGVSGGTERIDFIPSTLANPADLVASNVLAAIGNSPLQGVSPVQDGSQLIFTGVKSIVGLANETVVGIADNAGNLLAPNQPNGVTSFTILTPSRQLDFGDAPAPYPTLAGDDGARHIITSNPLFLGSRVDAETDGQPNATATGDDLFIITALSTLNVMVDSSGQSLQIPENAGAADVNDGDTFQIDNGLVSVTFELDSDGLTTEGNTAISFIGGETVDQVADSLVAAIGSAGLGVAPTKSGDKVLLHNDDEDGVAFVGEFNSFLDTTAEVTASGPGLLNAWIDFNADGDWNDAGEQVFVDEPLAAGLNTLTIRTPVGAATGLTYARFRFSTDAGLLPTGLASNGEVEDYRIDIAPGTPPTAVDDPLAANAAAYTVNEDNLLTINAALGVLANDSDPDGAIPAPTVNSFDAVSANGATVVVNADGSFTYDPRGALDFLAFGEEVFDTFTYTATDGRLTSATATATIRVRGLNDAPVAIDNSYATDEATAVSGNALTDDTGLGVDSDLDASNTLTVFAINGGSLVGGGVVLPSGATVTLAANGDFTYDPTTSSLVNVLAAGETGADSFTYSISDGSGGTAIATVSLTLHGLNDPPVAVDNAYVLDEDTALAANAILDNTGAGVDSDADASNTLSVTAVNGAAGDVGNSIVLASGATLLVNADGSFNYDPTTSTALNALAVGESAADLFTYTISDGVALSQATVSLTITGVNDAPTASDNAYATDEKTTALGDLISDDTGAGIDFDPDASDVLVVSAVNGAAGNVGGTIALPSDAQLTVQTNGLFSYNPTTSGVLNGLGVGESFVETFTYTIDDGNGGTATATATITTSGVNDTPIANAKSFNTDENTALSGNIMNGGGPADSDIDQSDILSVTAINGVASAIGQEVILGSGAKLTVGSDGSFAYDPTTSPALNALGIGQSSSDTFTYTLSDGHGGFATNAVTVQVAGVNDAPIAVSNAYDVNEDTTLNGDLILNNSGSGIDIDPEGGVLAISQINGVAITDGQVIVLSSGAELTIFNNGQFTYSAIPAFNGLSVGQIGNDAFSYTLIDDQGAESTAAVSITITGENDAPLAIDNSYAVSENATVFGNMLIDDTGLGADVDGDALDTLVVSAVEGSPAAVGLTITLPSGAKLSTAADGSFNYDPTSSSLFAALAAGESAPDSFTYTIADGHGGFSTATVSLTVGGVNNNPLASLNVYNTNEDTSVSGNVISQDTGAGPDQDPDVTDLLAVSAINGNSSDVGSTFTLPSGAELVVNADGSFTYDPSTSLAFNALAVGAPGADSFTYTIDDGNGGSDTALVAISITGVNDRPVAVADAANTTTGSSVTIAVLANDTDIDGVIDPNSPNVLVVDRLPDVGSLSLNGDGTIDYRADSLFVGQDIFQYRVRDDQGALSLPTIVTIDISQGTPGFTNPRNAADVNDDGNVDLQDVLILINDLRQNGNPHVLTPPASGVAPFVDTNNDLAVSTSDILVVLQELRTQSGEGESAPGSALDLAPLQYATTPLSLMTPVPATSDTLATANASATKSAVEQTLVEQTPTPPFGSNISPLENSLARYGSSGNRHHLEDLETALDDIAGDISAEWQENSKGDPLGDIDRFLPPA